MKSTEYFILLAEDDALIRYLTYQSLSDYGYCVIEAKNGEEAIKRAAEYGGTIHVLITNVRMPRIDGHELARSIKSMIPEIKVLIISAHNEADFPPEARSHDFALLKPVKEELVLSTVANLLQQRGDTPARVMAV